MQNDPIIAAGETGLEGATLIRILSSEDEEGPRGQEGRGLMQAAAAAAAAFP